MHFFLVESRTFCRPIFFLLGRDHEDFDFVWMKINLGNTMVAYLKLNYGYVVPEVAHKPFVLSSNLECDVIG